MARIEFTESNGGTGKPGIEGEVLYELGIMYATGRDCELNFVEAHKWLNIAAIKGFEPAAEMRADVSASMTKGEIAQALRAAREWMSIH